jgi:hypothetical protein
METPGNKQADNPSLPPVTIRRGVPAELTIHAVADHELESLAHGSADSSSSLNFAIFLLSTSVSFFIALLTAVLTSRVFTVFVVITTVGFLNGVLLLMVWHRKRSSVWDLVERIRSRVPAEGVQEPGALESSDFQIRRE